MKSSRRKASQTPTATASSPMYRWASPGILALLYSSLTCSSEARIFAIWRYMWRFCSSSIRGSIAWVVIASPSVDGPHEAAPDRDQSQEGSSLRHEKEVGEALEVRELLEKCR